MLDLIGAKQRVVGSLLVCISVIAGLGLAELLARKLQKFSAAPDYVESIRETVLTKERLWAPNLKVDYDIRGLYPGARMVQLRTSPQRLIEPQPDGKDPLKILFLGGSTTEALYVEEKKRWVALLNSPDKVGTYNGGQSGANAADAYYAFRYLVGQGLRFDVVVLMTLVNDYKWESRFFESLGHHLRTPDYHDDLAAYYRMNHESQATWLERCSWRFALCRYLDRAKKSQESESVAIDETEKAGGEAIGSVTATYLRALREKKNTHDGKEYELSDLRSEIDAAMKTYRANAVLNIAMLAKEVKSSGAQLVVLSEPSSFGAETKSFHRDLRGGFWVTKKKLSQKATVAFFQELNRTYLEAAIEAGAQTFDFASQMPGNDPDGGKYFYDEVHYTPHGCETAAKILRPQLSRFPSPRD